jgi:hypothetical protein
LLVEANVVRDGAFFTSPLCHGFYVLFRHTILKMCADTTEFVLYIVRFAMLFGGSSKEGIGGKSHLRAIF